MAVAQVGTTVVAEAATGTTVTVGLPTGAGPGHLLIVAVGYKQSAAMATPTGWTLIGTTGSGTAGFGLFYRWYSSEPASYTFTVPITDNVTAEMSAWSGVDTTTPLDVAVVKTTAGSSTSFTMGRVTPVSANTLLLYTVISQTTGTSMTADAALTVIANTTGTGRRIVQATEPWPTASISTARVFTNGGTTATSHAGELIALRPSTSSAVVAPTVNAGADATLTLGATFTQTATEGGGTPDSRAWTVVSGPAAVGTTIGTSAALSWAPATAGTYVLRYTATNTAGSASDDLTLVVNAPVPTATTPIVGGVTASAAKLIVKTTNATAAVMVAATDDTFSTVLATSSAATPNADGYAAMSVSGLPANTRVRWGVRLNGSSTIEAAPRGWFWTKRSAFLATGESIELGFTSCFDTPADPTVLSVIAARSTTRAFMFLGDFGYPNFTTNNQAQFRDHYEAMLVKSGVAAITAAMPFEDVWDDHDWGGDGSDGTSAVKPAANAAWRARFPTYTLPSTTATGIWRTWCESPDVRIIMLDLRSQSTPAATADSATKTRLGAEQLAWYQGVIKAATEPVIIVCSSVPPVAQSVSDDDWGSYSTERAALDAFHVAQGKRERIFFVSGDMHALAYDDGTSVNNGFHRPVFQAAPSGGKNGSVKGGPYSSGTPVSPSSTAEGFAGLITVTKLASGYSVGYTAVNQANATKITSPTFSVAGLRVLDAWTGTALERRAYDVWDGAAAARRQLDTWDGTKLVLGDSTGTGTTPAAPAPAALATETFPGANGVGWPSQWTSSTDGGAVIDQQGGRGRLLTNSGGYALSALAYLSGMAAVADIDVTLDVTFTDLGEQYFFIGVRTDGTRAYYLTNSYSLVLNPSDTGVYFTHDQTSGSTQLGWTPWPSPWTVNVARRVRYQVQGTTLRAKVWDIGTTEPSTWALTVTDTTLSAAGRLALQYGNGNAGTQLTAYVDNITVTAP